MFWVCAAFLPLQPLRGRRSHESGVKISCGATGYFAAHCIGVGKWRMVVPMPRRTVGFCDQRAVLFGGLFGHAVSALDCGGDVVRLAWGIRPSPRPAAVLTGNLVDRFLDVVAQAGLVLLGVLLVPSWTWAG